MNTKNYWQISFLLLEQNNFFFKLWKSKYFQSKLIRKHETSESYKYWSNILSNKTMKICTHLKSNLELLVNSSCDIDKISIKSNKTNNFTLTRFIFLKIKFKKIPSRVYTYP